MGEGAPGQQQFNHMGVKEALESGRIGFDEISVEAVVEVITNSPKNKTFLVPDDRYVATYSHRATSLGRNDVGFEVETAG